MFPENIADISSDLRSILFWMEALKEKLATSKPANEMEKTALNSLQKKFIESNNLLFELSILSSDLELAEGEIDFVNLVESLDA